MLACPGGFAQHTATGPGPGYNTRPSVSQDQATPMNDPHHDRPRVLVDWGTSNCRAYLCDAHGRVLDSRQGGPGAVRVEPGGHARALDELIGPWRQSAGHAPVWMAGMVGSRQGWVEAPYAPCPATPEALGALSVSARGSPWPVRIAPGVSLRRELAGGGTAGPGPLSRADVMRGEEVQVFGAARLLDLDTGVFCLPGTHSKWVWLDGGAIRFFVSVMSGELYALLLQHSILGRLLPEDGPAGTVVAPDDPAFERGLAVACRGEGVMSALFSARADCLLGLLPAGGIAAYLSGLLIGSELAELAPRLEGEARPVVLIGAPALTDAYARALTGRGLDSTRVGADQASIAGLMALSRPG